MKPHFIALILLLLVFGSIAKGDTNSYPAKKEKLEKLILAKVRTVWEVKYYFATTPKSSKPSLEISGEPDSTRKYYWIQLGINNFDMFRSTENFCVDPKTLKVYYWDVFADDTGFSDSAIIPLAQWRVLRQTPDWQKRHTYKHGKLVVLVKQ